MIELDAIIDELPAGFDALRAEALAEGFRQVERLATDWETRAARFDREGEALLAARLNGVLAGIGGLTIEPVAPDSLRMRRFYVRAPFRRCGVGREIVRALLARVKEIDRQITVNAGAGSGPFWEALGFVADRRDGHTHILKVAEPK
jgi:GNAT superfamily N-acetyltransferase